MTKPCITVGRVTAEGQLLQSRSERRTFEAAWPRFAGQKVELELRVWKSKRTTAQNARYWALLTVGATSLWGRSLLKDTLHDELAHVLLGLPPLRRLL